MSDKDMATGMTDMNLFQACGICGLALNETESELSAEEGSPLCQDCWDDQSDEDDASEPDMDELSAAEDDHEQKLDQILKYSEE